MNCTQIRQEGGYPTLYVDGKRTAPLIYALSDVPLGEPDGKCAQRNIPLFHEAGIDLVSVCTQIDLDWKENGEYTAEHQIKCIREITKANPNAKILFRLNLTPPYWWMRKYPEELIKYYGVGSADTGRGVYVIQKDSTNEIKASYASKKWQRDVIGVLQKMRDVLEREGLAKYVFAIQIAYGRLGEWHFFGHYYGNSGIFEGDYSAPMLEYFRAYLKKKYKTDKALQKAWGDTRITLQTAALATPAKRKAYQNDNGFLYRFPEYSMQALDSLKCMQLSAPHAISKFAKAVKKQWNGQVLTGAFYGYFFGCGDVYGRMLEPHILLDDKNIDFLAGPSAYTANKRAGNATFLRYFAETMRLNGKLFICEMDQGFKAHAAYRNDPDPFYTCENNAEYNAIMKRNVLENILRGMGSWYFDHRLNTDNMWEKKNGYWDDPERLAAIEKVRSFAERMRQVRGEFVTSADVLIVYDTQSVYHLGPSLTGDGSDVHNTYNQFDMADAIAKSGAGYDMILLYDLQKCDISKYKCVLFVACEAMRKTDYDYIRKVVMGGNRTVAFMRKNGYIVEGRTAISNMTDLYGVAIPSGYYEEQREAYKLVIEPQFMYDRDFYRRLFECAGAHIYTNNGEVVCAENGFVAVHTKGVSQTTVHLKSGDVTVRTGECDTVVLDAATGERML